MGSQAHRHKVAGQPSGQSDSQAGHIRQLADHGSQDNVMRLSKIHRSYGREELIFLDLPVSACILLGLHEIPWLDVDVAALLELSTADFLSRPTDRHFQGSQFALNQEDSPNIETWAREPCDAPSSSL